MKFQLCFNRNNALCILHSALFLLSLFRFDAAADNPKREFRGAWLHIIGQSQYQDIQQKGSDKLKEYIVDQIDKLHRTGCNAVIFQVRPSADAAYISDIEPWTSWITGKRGTAPNPVWDPLEFAVEQAHKRGMELHAWLNPYRVTSSPKDILPSDHISKLHPERFFRYDGKVFFDPAYQENRDYICTVVRDITKRYDIDAIHIDDYFYPYPVAGKKIPDDASFKKFGSGENIADWRRHNVDMLIEQMHDAIKETKPWVRFGVSPFGIWRNKKTDPRGSDSNGLQNYDGLYADVLLWAKNGWVDYLAPQLYWTLDFKAAPSRHLAHWWNDNSQGVDVYIGQDVQRTMTNADPNTGDTNELATKIRLSRELPNIKGNVWWHGYWVTDNLKGVADSLSYVHQQTVALPPAYGDPDVAPKPVRNLHLKKKNNGVYLVWQTEKHKGVDTDQIRFVVYSFLPDEKLSLDNVEAIMTLTPDEEYLVSEDDNTAALNGMRFAVTALDRNNRESEPVELKL